MKQPLWQCLTPIEFHLYIFIFEKYMNLNLDSLLLGILRSSFIELVWIQFLNSLHCIQMFVRLQRHSPQDFSSKTKCARWQKTVITTSYCTLFSLNAIGEELIIWKKKISNVIMFGKISTIAYLGEKERYLAHSLLQTYDLCQKCFITLLLIYNTDSVDIFKVLWCHKLKTLPYLCSHISPKFTSVVSHSTDWGYGEILQIVIWNQSMNNSSSLPCLTPSALLFTQTCISCPHTHTLVWKPQHQNINAMIAMKSHALLAPNSRSNQF